MEQKTAKDYSGGCWPAPDRSGNPDITQRSVGKGMQNLYDSEIFIFGIQDVAVKRKETTFMTLRSQRSHGDDGWWSGWQQRRGSCRWDIWLAVVPTQSSSRCCFRFGSNLMFLLLPVELDFFLRVVVRLTRRCKHHRRRSCCSPCTPRYQQPCASRCSFRRRCRCNGRAAKLRPS
jgi:hypothetical protein